MIKIKRSESGFSIFIDEFEMNGNETRKTFTKNELIIYLKEVINILEQ